MAPAANSEFVSLVGDRSNNQDRAICLQDDRRLLMVVADGMGGHSDGASAAEAVIETAAQLFRENQELPATGLMQRIALQSHLSLLELHPNLSNRDQPRTTVVMLHCQAGRAVFAHAGDSRGYLLRDQQTLYRTQDHSVVAEMMRRGELSEEQARRHPLRNQVTRCIGGQGRPAALQFTPCPPLQENDQFLLCSDGFWEPLESAEIASDRPLQELAQIAVGRRTGRADNCTALRSGFRPV